MSIFGERVCKGYLEQSKGTKVRLCSDRSGALIQRGQDLSSSFVFESCTMQEGFTKIETQSRWLPAGRETAPETIFNQNIALGSCIFRNTRP